VLCALRAGYRRIDTAAVYRNEEEIGRAVRDSQIPREQIFVTTKLHPRHTKSRDDVIEAARASAVRLGLGYVFSRSIRSIDQCSDALSP
jgi:diketogulonate reductase-like aldo/keto reductase